MKWPVTWRQLTVGEKLQIQKPDVAVGYRVQAGGDQWLFYRSLAAPASRTLLGQNVLHEFYAARFDMEGEADELLASIRPAAREKAECSPANLDDHTNLPAPAQCYLFCTRRS